MADTRQRRRSRPESPAEEPVQTLDYTELEYDETERPTRRSRRSDTQRSGSQKQSSSSSQRRSSNSTQQRTSSESPRRSSSQRSSSSTRRSSGSQRKHSSGSTWEQVRDRVVVLLAGAVVQVVETFQTLTHRKTPEAKRTEAGAKLTVWLSAATLAVMALLALCIPLRPTYSEDEQRNLATFPVPTVATLLDGAFFSGVSTWYSDTFPFREQFVGLSAGMKELYGFQTVVIHNGSNGDSGDDIPDIPDPVKPVEGSTSSVQPEQSTSATQPEQSTTTGEQSSDAPAESSQSVPEQKPEDKPDDQKPDDQKPEGGSETSGSGTDGADGAGVEKLSDLLVIGDRGYEYYNFSQKVADQYISAINRANTLLGGKARVFDMVVPNSMDICVDAKVRKEVNSSDQHKAINYMYGSMQSSVTPVDVFDTMNDHNAKGEYVYYRTDHHWTALGAYYAYQDFCKAAKRDAADLDSFTKHSFKDFKGSFYRQSNSSKMKSNPDVVDAYEPPSTNKITIYWPEGKVSDYRIITDVSDWKSGTKYNTFIGGDEPFSIIQNPNINDGSAIMLVKESYGNAFAPFLVESYQYVYIVDYRYFYDCQTGTLVDVVNKYNIQDVLFLNTISTTRSSGNVGKLATFIG